MAVDVNNPAGIEVKLGDGSVVKGATLDEAFANLSEMKVNASRAIKDTSDKYEAEKSERARVEAELSSIREENERLKVAANPPPPVNANGKDFNKDTYFQLLGQDPIKANRYLLRFDLGLDKEEDVPHTFNEMRSQLNTVTQQVDAFTTQAVTAAFLAQNPDYPQGDMAVAQKLSAKVGEFTKNGMPYNAGTIGYAYYELVKSKEITPLDLTKINAEEQKREEPNPSLSGATSAALASEIEKAEKMNDKDLFALLQAKGMIR